MKTILCTSLPTNDLGLIVRALPIAAELTLRGFQVKFSNPAPAPQKRIAACGFENLLPCHPLYEFAFGGSGPSWSSIKSLGGPVKFVTDLIRSFPYRRLTDQVEVWDTDHASAIMGMLNPDYIQAQVHAYRNVIIKSGCEVVIDFWNPFACIASRSIGMPLATINQGDALPGSKGFIWWKNRQAPIPSVVPAINKVLDRYKLPNIDCIEELFVGDLTMVVGMPETDPLHGKVTFPYIGSVLWNGTESPLPPWLEYITRETRVIWLYPGNPNYGGLSKVFNSQPMLKACVKGLGQLSTPVILSMGYHQIPGSLGRLPSNFYPFPFVPGLQMASRCGLMIHHGGYGSCQTSLMAGAPSLIIPTFSERESNARRLASLGAAELILPQAEKNKMYFDPEEVKEKTIKAYNNPEYRRRAIECGERLRSYGGAQRAVDLMEEWINKKSTPVTDCRLNQHA